MITPGSKSFVSLLLGISLVYSISLNALESRPVLTLQMAKMMADACEAESGKQGWNPINIAIFDAGGNLILFRRQDDSYLGSIEIAQLKGRSSVMLPFPTRYIGENIAYKDPKKPHGIEQVPGLVVFPGGLPVKTQSGRLIGGIGVSGASSGQDEECAKTAIRAISEALAAPSQ